jgi:hypothetical protein
MLGPARTAEHGLCVLVRLSLQLGEGDEAQLAAPDEPQLGLDVSLEGVQDMPSEIAASWRLNATRGTFIGEALTLGCSSANRSNSANIHLLTSDGLQCPLLSRG